MRLVNAMVAAWGLLALLLLGSCGGAGLKPSSSDSEESELPSRKTARLYLNSDGGSGALYANGPPITADQVCRVVNELEGTQVDVFIQCASYGTYVLYDTQVGEVYGRGMTEFENPNFGRLAQNVLGLLEQGTDPLEIWAARTHELGMEFWASLRMNDIHKDWVKRWPSKRGRWERERPHVAIGKDVPDRYVSLYGRGFSYAFDYAQQEVRDLKFGLVEEICRDYDVDGIELDFLSHPMVFKKGQEEAGMPIMTGFVRRIRNRLDEIGRRKGRRITLMVRVLPTLALNREIGFDVVTWIREGLVDVIAPATRGYLDMNPDLASFVEAARRTQVQVLGGISDLYVRDYTGSKTGRASLEMMRAAAQSFWGQGVSGLHLFNFDCHASGIQGHSAVNSLIDTSRQPLLSPEERQMLTEIGDPELISRKDKHYFITRDMAGRTPEEGGEMQLPVDLDEGQEKILRLFVGDDVEAASQDGVLESLSLVVRLSAYSRWDDDLRLVLNGRRLRGEMGNGRLRFENAPVRQGLNELTIRLRRRGGRGPLQPVRVQGVELFVDYRM